MISLFAANPNLRRVLRGVTAVKSGGVHVSKEMLCLKGKSNLFILKHFSLTTDYRISSASIPAY